MDTKTERQSRSRANNELHALGLIYHNGIPVGQCIDILNLWGFNGARLEGIYCGHDGETMEQVGPKTYCRLAWHRMESGRYEITSYLS